MWRWRRLLRVPWTAKRSNQLILKEINPEHSLKGLMLKLKLQYFGHPMWRADSLEKILMLGKIEGKRRMGWQRMRWLDSITDSMDMSFSKLHETVKNREAWHAIVHRVAKCQTGLSNWTTTTTKLNTIFLSLYLEIFSTWMFFPNLFLLEWTSLQVRPIYALTPKHVSGVPLLLSALL